jgi:large subunit ribosomal protein L2
MGSPLEQQRRGKGSPNYRSNREGEDTDHYKGETTGEVVDIKHDSSRSAPVALVEFEEGEKRAIVAPENLAIGDEIELGVSAPVEPGNTLPIREIPEGVPIYNIEIQPNDGGKMVKSSGTYAFVVTHEKDSSIIELPSGEFKEMNKDCRATIGKVAGGGRKDKPFVKAGNKSKAMHAKGLPYPKVSGVSMNAVDHPFGGSAKPGKAKTVSRQASPGRKVGNIAAKRSGKKEE